MRIAICLSGQPRTWHTCYPTWFNLIKKIKQVYDVETVDFFCHLWDYNSAPHGLIIKQGLDHHEVQGIQISQEEKQKIVDTLNPLSIVFDNEVTNKSRIEFIKEQNKKFLTMYGRTPFHWCAGQFYSIMYAAHLKKLHELKTNKYYDMCFRIRGDLFFEDKEIDTFLKLDMCRPEPNTIYSAHTARDDSYFPRHRLGDTFWFSDSITFNRICDYYRWLPILGTKMIGTDSYAISTEHAMYLYAKMLCIDINGLIFDPKIFRGKEYLDTLLTIDNTAKLRGNELV